MTELAALAPLIVAVTVAVVAPWFAFRLALRQDRARWLREQRLQLYVEMLTEAHAEQNWLEYHLADDEIRESIGPFRPDMRLPPLARARLGARGSIIGSQDVNRAFNRMQAVAGKFTLRVQRNEGVAAVARVEVGRTFDELQSVIRHELGADDIRI